MKYFYVGSFPPPYGGVTRKNEMLFTFLSKRVKIERIVASNSILDKIAQIIVVAIGNSSLIIGVGSNSNLQLLSRIYAAVGHRGFRKAIVIAMGGTLHDYARLRPRFMSDLSKFSKVFVEAEEMARSLASEGLENIAVFPNCRVRPKSRKKPNRANGRLQCLYYSNICPEKGSDIALTVAEALPDLDLDFWGEFIDNGYKTQFLSNVEALPNCAYRGVFRASNEDIYELISSYDLLLFPSIWKHEGVPGTLVESKVAGVPAVVFDNNFNSEIVVNAEEGLVIDHGDIKGFINEVRDLDLDRSRLFALAEGAYRSADRFFLDACADELLRAMDGSSKEMIG